jgi:hypothetical protein
METQMSFVRKAVGVILRPVAWVAYWLSEALWQYHPPHTTLQLKDAAAAAAAFHLLDMDAVWEHDPAWKDDELPGQIKATLASFSRKEWEELKGMVLAEERFVRDNLEMPRLWGDLTHLHRKTP